MNLASFADLAVRLVNSALGGAGPSGPGAIGVGDVPAGQSPRGGRASPQASTADGDADPLRSCAAFREFVANRPFLAGPVTQNDLDRLKLLRAELATIFVAAAEGDAAKVAAKLNALLITHPLHPVIVSHEGDERWHLHLHESGSVADRYAAAAVIGLAMIATQVGVHKIGVCAMATCERTFIDSSSNRSRRYCGEHRPVKGNVMTLRGQGGRAAQRPSGSAVSEAS